MYKENEFLLLWDRYLEYAKNPEGMEEQKALVLEADILIESIIGKRDSLKEAEKAKNTIADLSAENKKLKEVFKSEVNRLSLECEKERKHSLDVELRLRELEEKTRSLLIHCGTKSPFEHRIAETEEPLKKANSAKRLLKEEWLKAYGDYLEMKCRELSKDSISRLYGISLSLAQDIKLRERPQAEPRRAQLIALANFLKEREKV